MCRTLEGESDTLKSIFASFLFLPYVLRRRVIYLSAYRCTAWWSTLSFGILCHTPLTFQQLYRLNIYLFPKRGGYNIPDFSCPNPPASLAAQQCWHAHAHTWKHTCSHTYTHAHTPKLLIAYHVATTSKALCVLCIMHVTTKGEKECTKMLNELISFSHCQIQFDQSAYLYRALWSLAS